MTDRLHDRLQEVRRSLGAIKMQLEEQGYVFESPETALSEPSPETDRIVSRIESSVGRIPEALVAFWRIVGSVDFCGSHSDWSGCEYPDPIVVYPPTEAEHELESFLQNRDEYREAYGSFRVPIAPDSFHKENVSGGMWYGIAVPDDRMDPPLLEEPNQTTFLNYLDLVVSWGGFPGLKRATGTHTWPQARPEND